MPGLLPIEGIAKAAEGITASLMNGFNSLFTSKDEKMQDQAKLDAIQADLKEKLTNHLTDIASLQQEAMKVELADVASARDMNIKVEQADKASWLSKNIAPIIGSVVVLMWVLLTSYIVARMLNLLAMDPKIDMVPVLGIYSTLTAVATLVMQFYFGSSQGSKDKAKVIADMTAQNG